MTTNNKLEHDHLLIAQSRIVTQKWQEASVSASDTEFPRNDKLNDTRIKAIVLLSSIEMPSFSVWLNITYSPRGDPIRYYVLCFKLYTLRNRHKSPLGEYR